MSMKPILSKALAVFCFLAWCPCCFPCYIGLARARRKRNRRSCVVTLDSYYTGPTSPSAVHPLCGRRRRLSISGEPVSTKTLVEENCDGEKVIVEKQQYRGLEEDQVYYTQEQCQLFAKLPLEIRQMIYHEVLGGYHLYLAVIEKRLRHCKLLGNFFGGLDEWREFRGGARDGGSGTLLPLLQTCRRIYTEATPLLYSRNTFTATSTGAVLSLTSSFRLNRFDALTSLNLTWTIPHPGRLTAVSDFDYVCTVVASMKGLRRLSVKLWPHKPMREYTKAELVRALVSLTRIQRPDLFVVTVGSVEMQDLEVGEVPYMLQWTGW